MNTRRSAQSSTAHPEATSSQSAASSSASSTFSQARSDSAARNIPRLTMGCNTDQFDAWLLRIRLHVQLDKPELLPLLDLDAESCHNHSTDAQILAAVIFPYIADDLVARFRRQITSTGDRPTINGAKLFYLVCEHFKAVAPPEELPEEMFARGLRSCYRDKYRSVPDFVRAAQGILQSVQSAASSSLPMLERMMALHVLTQLGINNFCPWAPTMLAEYRKAYRLSPSPDSVPKGFALADVVMTVIGHITVAPGARDIYRGRYTDRPQCTYCGRYGHNEATCNTKKAPTHKGAATGVRAMVHEVTANDSEFDYHGYPVQQFLA